MDSNDKDGQTEDRLRGRQTKVLIVAKLHKQKQRTQFNTQKKTGKGNTKEKIQIMTELYDRKLFCLFFQLVYLVFVFPTVSLSFLCFDVIMKIRKSWFGYMQHQIRKQMKKD